LRSHLVYVLILMLPAACPARSEASQEPEPPAQHQHDQQTDRPSAAAWSWTSGANVFFGYNYQSRKYADFSAWESQNWLMLGGQRTAGQSRLTIETMLSFEPFTIQALGSPQLFQTGESYQQLPLVNYQHPHDLLMELGATYRLERGPLAYELEADLVGSPALGPTPFMHRLSARHNPQVPLAHHSLDSTHITPGVLRAGVDVGRLVLEASAFRGEEPDEDRLNIERPKLDSWSARIRWRQGPWEGQVSGGYLHYPEWFEPSSVTRFTGSLEFNGTVRSRPLNATVAWGRNRHHNNFNDTDDSYLLEWDFRASRTTSLYGRVEVMAKQILGIGFHPREFAHPHFYSDIRAFTVGYIRDLPSLPLTRALRGPIGIGGDISAYRTSPDMTALYDGSRSFHVFVRWSPSFGTAGHDHH
jgi:hypothetical protein